MSISITITFNNIKSKIKRRIINSFHKLKSHSICPSMFWGFHWVIENKKELKNERMTKNNLLWNFFKNYLNEKKIELHIIHNEK